MYIYDRPSQDHSYSYGIANRSGRRLDSENSVLHGLGGRPEVVSPATQAAEVKRRTDEIIKHAGEGKWASVERNYNWLMENEAFNLIPKGLATAAAIHELGAQASDKSGNKKLTQERLVLAQRSLETTSPIDDVSLRRIIYSLDAIEMAYGAVTIAPQTEPTSKKEHKRLQGRGPALIPVVWPFAPDQQKSIEVAALVIKDTGSFTGLLPAGNYTLAGQSFTVTAGTKLMRKKPKEVRWSN